MNASPVPEAAADWTIPQAWGSYTPEQHATWDTLFARQSALLPGRVAPEFLAGSIYCAFRAAASPISPSFRKR